MKSLLVLLIFIPIISFSNNLPPLGPTEIAVSENIDDARDKLADTDAIFVIPDNLAGLENFNSAYHITDERLHGDFSTGRMSRPERRERLHNEKAEKFMKGPGCRGGCAAGGAMIAAGTGSSTIGAIITWSCSETCQE